MDNGHDTIVMGINKKNQITFFKTYNYEAEKEQALKDLEYVQSKIFSYWYISGLEMWMLSRPPGVQSSETLTFNLSQLSVGK